MHRTYRLLIGSKWYESCNILKEMKHSLGLGYNINHILYINISHIKMTCSYCKEKSRRESHAHDNWTFFLNSFTGKQDKN